MYYVLDFDDTIVQTTINLRGDRSRLLELQPVPGARDLVARIGKDSTLLSFEADEAWQLSKIKQVGFENLFREISVVSTLSGKEDVIARIVKESGLLPEQVVVIGDRVDAEIAYGNRHGCTTVRVRISGEYKYANAEPSTDEQKPDFTVSGMEELGKVLDQLAG